MNKRLGYVIATVASVYTVIINSQVWKLIIKQVKVNLNREHIQT